MAPIEEVMVNTTEGTLGHLTPEETRKLQEVWIHLLRLCEYDTSAYNAELSALVPDRTAEWRREYLTGHAKGHPHVHHHHIPNHPTDAAKPIDAAMFKSLLWHLFMSDHPDVMVLRFLRARKFDIDRSMAMLLSCINWRYEQDVDIVVHKGDSVALQAKPSKDDKEFIAQYQSGKAFVRGQDKCGRPLFIVKVKLHLVGHQSNETMERFVLHQIESIRSFVQYPGGEKAVLVFDLTGFGLKNMDFHIVKFLVQVFEARYPEYLGLVLVHNAPWVFWGFWKIIRPWIDPVIAAKINFTSNNKDMAPYVSQENLLKCYGGKDNWEYKYVPPVEGENSRLDFNSANDEKRAQIRATREELVRKFEQASLEWAVKGLKERPGSKAAAATNGVNGHANGTATSNGAAINGNVNGVDDGTTAEQKNDERFDIGKQLHHNFWVLDPYVRARTSYHRSGVIGPNGEVSKEYKGVR